MTGWTGGELRWLRPVTGLLLLATSMAHQCHAENIDAANLQDGHHINTANAQRNGVGQNFAMLEKLLQDSSSAKTIVNSTNEEAHALHLQSLQLLTEARSADQAGNVDIASEKIQQAKQLFFQALKLAGTALVATKQHSDFDKRFSQVQTMLDAYERIGAEQAAAGAAAGVAQDAKKLMTSARRQFEANDLAAANQALEDAWLTIRLALVQLRAGKTLVRSLEFANKEEEYAYELDRNNTHFMLLEVLLREKQSTSSQQSAIDAAVAQARELRSQGEQQALTRDYDAAVKTLEDATRQILRAIRAAGIYIPG